MKFVNRYFWIWILSLVATVAYSSSSSQFNFLALADIHFDPFTVCTKKNVCPMINELRSASAEEWPKILGRYDVKMPKLGGDTTYPLLTAALSTAGKVADKKEAKFVLVLGDFMGHEFRKKYKKFSGVNISGYTEFSQKYFKLLTQQIGAAFPHADVYMVVGNNDSYHGDYVIKPNGQFFSDLAGMWSQLIKSGGNQAAMRKQFSYAGYYSLVLPYPENSQLIVMNSNLFSNKVKGKNLDAVALKQLDWLHQKLQEAKAANRHVFIAMHMPEGLDLAYSRIQLFRLHVLWKSQYIECFEKELKQFSEEVVGIFSGHVHHNWYQLRTFGDHEIPLIGVVAISPNAGNGPGFRDISYFTDPLRLDDMVNYSID